MTPRRNSGTLSAAFTVDATKDMVYDGQLQTFRGSAVEAGGRVKLGTATTAVVTVVDRNGKKLIDAVTYTSSTTIAPTPQGISGPLSVTVASSNGTLTVYWNIKK